MADLATVEEVAEAMYKLVAQAQGQKKLKPGDLTKSAVQIFGDRVDKKICKGAIKELIESGKCVYTYFGGSFIEIPHVEGAANK
jgi:hypothetical protein